MILVAIITSFRSCIAKYVVCNFILCFSKSSQIQQDGLFWTRSPMFRLRIIQNEKKLTLFLGHLHFWKLFH